MTSPSLTLVTGTCNPSYADAKPTNTKLLPSGYWTIVADSTNANTFVYSEYPSTDTTCSTTATQTIQIQASGTCQGIPKCPPSTPYCFPTQYSSNVFDTSGARAYIASITPMSSIPSLPGIVVVKYFSDFLATASPTAVRFIPTFFGVCENQHIYRCESGVVVKYNYNSNDYGCSGNWYERLVFVTDTLRTQVTNDPSVASGGFTTKVNAELSRWGLYGKIACNDGTPAVQQLPPPTGYLVNRYYDSPQCSGNVAVKYVPSVCMPSYLYCQAFPSSCTCDGGSLMYDELDEDFICYSVSGAHTNIDEDGKAISKISFDICDHQSLLHSCKTFTLANINTLTSFVTLSPPSKNITGFAMHRTFLLKTSNVYTNHISNNTHLHTHSISNLTPGESHPLSNLSNSTHPKSHALSNSTHGDADTRSCCPSIISIRA